VLLLGLLDADPDAFYLNGVQLRDTYTRNINTFTFANNFVVGDVVTIKIFATAVPDLGYYEMPMGLEKNPLNERIKTFTLGQASDHISSGLEILDNFVGRYPGSNNLRDISGFQNLTRRFLKHSSPAPLSIALLCDKEINIIKSIQYANKTYTDFKNSFITLANELYYDQTPKDFVELPPVEAPSIQLECNGVRIHLETDFDPILLARCISLLKGSLCSK
jgi:hypothetical protein